MKALYILFGILILMLSACKKDDGPGMPPINPDSDTGNQNRPPADFDLLAVENNGIEVDLLPSLSWEQATDPDGDVVTYDIYLDTVSDPKIKVASGQSTTVFTPTERLVRSTDYHWKVVASDGNGGENQSSTNKFKTRPLNGGALAVLEAPFHIRSSHTAVVFDTKIWVMGGFARNIFNSPLYFNDVWSSGDGEIWSQATEHAAFFQRQGHASVAFDNKLWVIGGVGSAGGGRNDIFFSNDGMHWDEAEALDETFSGRFGHTATVFKDRIWVIGGGQTEMGFNNEIWSSQDGFDWIQADFGANVFSARIGHTATVFRNKLWVIGGQTTNNEFLNDIWFSEDGLIWEKALTPGHMFLGRTNHTTVVYDDKLWVIAGFDNDDIDDPFNDIWFSSDGLNWFKVATDSNFNERQLHTATVFNDKIWLIGGFDIGNEFKNDIWTLD